jgi:hypothetical protein
MVRADRLAARWGATDQERRRELSDAPFRTGWSAALSRARELAAPLAS